MKIEELYAQTPVEKHQDIVISGNRLYFENEEYVIETDGDLRLVRSDKGLEQRLAQIEDKLSISK